MLTNHVRRVIMYTCLQHYRLNLLRRRDIIFVVSAIRRGDGSMKHVLSVFVENQTGVLVRVVSMFSRREFNIDSLSVGVTETPDFSRITVIVHGDENLIEQMIKQLEKMPVVRAVQRLAIKLSKICNDLRLMASGPRCGLNEINLPPKAPGSSIMPGKVNPVIPEVTNQVCFKVIGNDATVSFAAEAGQLELNVMEPIITESLFESLTWLKNAIETLTSECILGITVNKERCYEMVKNSIGIVTALNPIIGYKKSSKVAKEAHATGRSVYDIVIEQGIMSKEELDKALDPKEMLQSHKFTLK